MSDMTELKASVLEQSHEKGRLNLAAAKEKIQAEFDQKREHLVFEKESLRRQKLEAVQRYKQRESQQLENKARQSSLVTKQEVLKELFEEAKATMAAWSEGQHLDFLKAVMASYTESVEVAFGDLTARTFSEETWQALRGAYPQVTFVEETIANEAGFLISKGQVDDNFLYGHLIADIWEEESFRLASEIFKK
ncbi:V/A-type H+-transporting ATPase subunit E [Streptococcus rupicaprae]|uniref:V/A-type H+-transporting ATPase subunit E n=1 Tax=Streptococcus rupicaprae TaxID=759619 RepID=A0ABV2FK11_9STRE